MFIQVYEEIASHFSGTRHSPWPRVSEFLQSQPKGSVMLDIGCGNGKYLNCNSSCYMVGIVEKLKFVVCLFEYFLDFCVSGYI